MRLGDASRNSNCSKSYANKCIAFIIYLYERGGRIVDLMALRRGMLLMQKTQPLNLFDKDTMFSELTSGYLKNDGSITSHLSWYISDYIPVNGTSFVLKNVGGGSPSIVLYGENKQFLSGINYGTSGATEKTDVYIMSPSTAYFCRFSAYSSNGSLTKLNEYIEDIVLQYV